MALAETAEVIIANTQAITTILWTLAGLVLFGVFVWFAWRVAQILVFGLEWVNDRLAFERGLVEKVADSKEIKLEKYRMKKEGTKSVFAKAKDELMEESPKPEKAIGRAG